MQRRLPADIYTQEHMKHMLKTAVWHSSPSHPLAVHQSCLPQRASTVCFLVLPLWGCQQLCHQSAPMSCKQYQPACRICVPFGSVIPIKVKDETTGVWGFEEGENSWREGGFEEGDHLRWCQGTEWVGQGEMGHLTPLVKGLQWRVCWCASHGASTPVRPEITFPGVWISHLWWAQLLKEAGEKRLLVSCLHWFLK